MRVFFGAIVAAWLMVPGSAALSPTRARDASRDSVDLVELNRGYVAAFVNSDAAWYDAHLSPDYECLCPDGSVVRRQEFVEGSRKPMSYRSFSLDSVRVKLKGDVALITAITPYVRQDGSTGVSRYTDTWVRQGGTWKTWQAQITPVRQR